MNEEEAAITFQGSLLKVASTRDGTWIISFELQEGFDKTIGDIALMRGRLLQIAAIPIE